MDRVYTWDEEKRQANIAERGIDFTAVYDLDWSTVIEAQDTRREYGEVRMRAYGLIVDRLHCLIYTMRGVETRVISLRKANSRKVKQYEQAKD